jgi:hypothetical protein
MNQTRVEELFRFLNNIKDEQKLTPDILYYADETNLSTVQEGQKKVIGTSGKIRIGAMIINCHAVAGEYK